MKYKQLTIFDFMEDEKEINVTEEKYQPLVEVLKRDLRLIKKYLKDDSYEATITCTSYKYRWIFNQSNKLTTYDIGFTLIIGEKIYFYTMKELKEVVKTNFKE